MLEVSDYNRQHLEAQQEAIRAYKKLSADEIAFLKWLSTPYMYFRRELDRFNTRFFQKYCYETCFLNGKSACCGFESIMTFFADDILNIIWGGYKSAQILVKKLRKPNSTSRCVYLGPHGCIWYLKPISCAMFFCDNAKKHVFSKNREALEWWDVFTIQEKNFTWPSKPVLFDLLEDFFIHKKGISSPHMYYHSSPGLLRIKKKALPPS